MNEMYELYIFIYIILSQPLTRKQAANRSRSSINMKNFKKFNAKRKWKVCVGVTGVVILKVTLNTLTLLNFNVPLCQTMINIACYANKLIPKLANASNMHINR